MPFSARKLVAALTLTAAVLGIGGTALGTKASAPTQAPSIVALGPNRAACNTCWTGPGN